MYHLKDTIPNGIDLKLIPEVSFNPDGTLFAVTYLSSNEVMVFDARTRTAVRVFKNPEANFDSPHGVLLTENHLIVSNIHDLTRPSTFTVYNINAPSNEPVCVFITPYKHLREAHSLAIYNNVLVATYCHNTEGPGAVVSYQFDDNAGVIQATLDIIQDCFENFSDPKGVAFSKDGASVFLTYFTQKSIRNSVVIFGIDDAGRFTEQPTSVLERKVFCRLENIDIVGDTVVLCDTINGSVCLYDIVEDPQLKAPTHTVTENISLPHGAKLSPDKSMLVVTNYGLKVKNQVIHWQTPSRDNNKGVLVYDLKTL
jgi:DNA-binding beta-propeller fold protein YncE